MGRARHAKHCGSPASRRWRSGSPRGRASGARRCVALAGAALALGASAAAVERLEVESRPLSRGWPAGRWPRARTQLTGTRARGCRGARRPAGVRPRGRGASACGGRLEPTAGRVRVEVGGLAERPRLLDADRVAAWMTLRPASDAGDGLAAFGYCKSGAPRRAAPRRRGDTPCAGSSRALRERARDVFERAMPPGTERGLVRAMVLGDRSEIDDATAEAFKASGTYHVLALSGAQVALAGGAALVRGCAGCRRAVARGGRDDARDLRLRGASWAATCRSRAPR